MSGFFLDEGGWVNHCLEKGKQDVRSNLKRLLEKVFSFTLIVRFSSPQPQPAPTSLPTHLPTQTKNIGALSIH